MSERPIVVQKYGGSSVADVEKLRAVARKVMASVRAGNRVVVVVSAMGRTTDELLALARKVSPEPERRELDMLLTAGERISMSLLAMALGAEGQPAISLTGSQSGIITNHRHVDARIIEVRPFRVLDALEEEKVVIVAGFQGVSYRREVTTLGRGGSDTTAVALAAALDAVRCEIYSDVDGVYSADPRVVDNPKKLPEISYEEMQEMAELGAKVLNAQAVEFARRAGIAIYALATAGGGEGTVIRRFPPATPGRVVGIATTQNLLVLHAPPTIPLSPLCAELDALQIPAQHLQTPTQTTLLIDLQNVHNQASLSPRLTHLFGPTITLDDSLGSVSLIGAGINADNTNLRKTLAIAHSLSIPPTLIQTTSFRITLLAPRSALAPLAQSLHQHFIEAQP